MSSFLFRVEDIINQDTERYMMQFMTDEQNPARTALMVKPIQSNKQKLVSIPSDNAIQNPPLWQVMLLHSLHLVFGCRKAFCSHRSKGWLSSNHLLIELRCYLVDVNAEILPQELADIRVLVVAPDLLGCRPARAVDVDIHCRVAVRAPTDVRPQAEYGRKDGSRVFGVRRDQVELLVEGVGNAEAVDDQVSVDPVLE